MFVKPWRFNPASDGGPSPHQLYPVVDTLTDIDLTTTIISAELRVRFADDRLTLAPQPRSEILGTRQPVPCLRRKVENY